MNAAGTEQTRIWVSGAEIDLATGVVVRGADRILLTARERELLAYLCARPGRDVPRDELLTEVWGYVPTTRTRAIDNMVRKLRAKIERDPDQPRHVTTVGGGYRFEQEERGPDLRYSNQFFGRQDVIAEVEATFDKPGCTILTGPPGIGKSRLAWELVRRWRRSPYCWFVTLQDVHDRAGVVSGVAVELGVPGDSAFPGASAAFPLSGASPAFPLSGASPAFPLSGASPAFPLSGASPTVVEALVDRIGVALAEYGPALLVLDNLEQLPDGALDMVERWCAGAPQLCVLGSSRAVGRMPGREVAVPALEVEVACAMFGERAHRAWAAFTSGPSVRGLCEQLDGNPLCVELAAARTAVLPVDAILERLGRTLDLLRAPSDGRSLEAAIAGSWELLSDEEREGLARCSVFAGGFDVAAAEQVLGRGGTSGNEVVRGLVGWSLLQSVQSADGNRIRTLVGVQAFAATRVRAEVLADARDRHLAWFSAEMGRSPRRVLQADGENVRAALVHALSVDADSAADLAMSMASGDLWLISASESVRWLRRALEAGPDPHRTVRIRGVLAARHTADGDHPEALRVAAAALREAEALGDTSLVAWARVARGIVWTGTGHRNEGIAELSEVEQQIAFDDPLRRALLFDLAGGLASVGRYAEAEQRSAELIALVGGDLPSLGAALLPRTYDDDDGWMHTRALLALSDCLSRQGRWEAAEQRAIEALALVPAHPSALRARGLFQIAAARCSRGAIREALDLLDEVQPLASRFGDWVLLGRVSLLTGELRLDLGEYEAAITALRSAAKHDRSRERSSSRPYIQCLLGAAMVLAGARHAGLEQMRAATRCAVHPDAIAIGWSYLALATSDPVESAAAAERVRAVQLPPGWPGAPVVELATCGVSSSDTSEVRLGLALLRARDH